MITFSYDIGSPFAWLAAERIDALFVPHGVPVHWEPVFLGALFQARGSGSWAVSDQRDAGIAEVERRARAYDLPDPVWPGEWPTNSLAAGRAATWATALGAAEGRAFAHAGYALHFVEGVAVHEPDFVFRAAERAELDADAAVAAAQDPQVKDALRETTDRAFALGVQGVPTFRRDGEVVFGDDELDAAAARWTGAMGALAGPPAS